MEEGAEDTAYIVRSHIARELGYVPSAFAPLKPPETDVIRTGKRGRPRKIKPNN